jgi:hypothetical protein
MPLPLNDDELLTELRGECARLDSAERPAVLGGAGAEGYDAVARLYELRDVALARGLPLPSNCPMDRMEH